MHGDLLTSNWTKLNPNFIAASLWTESINNYHVIMAEGGSKFQSLQFLKLFLPKTIILEKKTKNYLKVSRNNYGFAKGVLALL